MILEIFFSTAAAACNWAVLIFAPCNWVYILYLSISGCCDRFVTPVAYFKYFWFSYWVAGSPSCFQLSKVEFETVRNRWFEARMMRAENCQFSPLVRRRGKVWRLKCEHLHLVWINTFSFKKTFSAPLQTCYLILACVNRDESMFSRLVSRHNRNNNDNYNILGPLVV